MIEEINRRLKDPVTESNAISMQKSILKLQNFNQIILNLINNLKQNYCYFNKPFIIYKMVF